MDSRTRNEDRDGKTARSGRRCVFCGAEAPLVWVHGHGQCAGCGTNVEECCRGELQARSADCRDG